MGILRAIVGTQSLLVRARKAKFTKRGSVRSKFISDDNRRRDKAMAAKEFAQQSHGRSLVAPGPNENVKNLTLVIDGTPHGHLLSGKRVPHFAQLPPGLILRTRLRPILGNHRAEFDHPPADCLIADSEATLCQEILNIAVA